jgi:hypothetical protein
MNASEADNGRAGGKRVQFYNNNKSHGPPMLLVNPWHATHQDADINNQVPQRPNLFFYRIVNLPVN